MSNQCEAVTEEGNAVCVPGSCACSNESKSKQTVQSLNQSLSVIPQTTRWKKIRGAVVFGVACVLSPCCAPLLVPLALALLAGTPVAVWMSANLGWVYGVLTMISIATFILAFRWMRSKKTEVLSIERSEETWTNPVHAISRKAEKV
jgi:hypothetical protein